MISIRWSSYVGSESESVVGYVSYLVYRSYIGTMAVGHL
jgi:hypothetical protein